MRSEKNLRQKGLADLCDRGQLGFAMPVAIFLLVVLAGLAAAMANLSVMQHTGAALDLQGARAYQAARAGIEWGLYQSLIVTPAACPGTTSFSPVAPELSAFTVTVTCASTLNADTNPNILVRRLTSIACNEPVAGNCVPRQGGTADYVERVMQVTL